MQKIYLCADLKDPLTNEIKTCYLAYNNIDALLKYTSYCESEDMLIETLPHDDFDVRDTIKNNIVDNGYGKFYFKKTKNGKPFKVIYKNNDDLLYADFEDIKTLFLKSGFYIDDNDFKNRFYDDNVKKIYKLLDELVANKKTRERIILTFFEKYDYDKYPELIDYEKAQMWEKIGLCREGLDIALRYICSEPYKKLVLSSNLKRILRKRLIHDFKLVKNKEKLGAKLAKNKTNFYYINDEIKKNLKEFYNIKGKEKDKEKSSAARKVHLKDTDKIPVDEETYYDDILYLYEKKISEELQEKDPDYDLIDELRIYVDSINKERIRKK